jgi:hypothetical protein
VAHATSQAAGNSTIQVNTFIGKFLVMQQWLLMFRLRASKLF